MKWLLMVVAFVLGAAITWFLTVRRVSRTVPVGEETAPAVAQPEMAPVVWPGGAVAGAVGVAGGADLVAATSAGVVGTVADSSEDAEGVADINDAQDDASGFGGPRTPTSDSPGAAEGWDRDAEDEDALLSRPSGDVSIPPVADAKPKGDVAGVGDPTQVAAVDEIDDAPEATAKPDKGS